jgi:hypothetical protein
MSNFTICSLYCQDNSVSFHPKNAPQEARNGEPVAVAMNIEVASSRRAALALAAISARAAPPAPIP